MNTSRYSIREKLNLKKDVYGTWCMLPSPEVIDVISKTDELDFVIIDMEHGSMDYMVAQRMATAAQSNDCSAIIRSPRNDESNILKSLDIGSDGLIVPHVSTVDGAKNIINYSKYSPIGNRSYSPYTRAGSYTLVPNNTEKQNNDSMIGVIIEDSVGLDNIEKITEMDYIDLVYIGTYDIACSMGLHVNSKLVLDELERCAKIVRDKNKSVGCLFHDEKELNLFKSFGINFLVYGVDSQILYNKFKELKTWG